MVLFNFYSILDNKAIGYYTQIFAKQETQFSLEKLQNII